MKLPYIIQKYLFLFSSIGAFTITNYVMAIPMNLYHDPSPLYTIRGNDFFNVPIAKKPRSLDILPFYYSSAGAKDASGKKVPAGDRLGRWNMIGLLHGVTPDASQTTLNAAYTNLSSISAYGKSLTDNTYSDSTQSLGYFSVPSNIEGKGVRFNARIPLFAGLVASLKSGFVHYHRSPKFVDKSTTTSADGTSIIPSGISSDNLQTVRNNLMTASQLAGISKDISLSFDPYSKTALEDTVAQLSWGYDFLLSDREGKEAVTITPSVALGVIIPTGEKQDQDKAFSVPTGNNGHTGLLVQANIEMDFSESVGFNLGGEFIAFNERKEGGIRMPTSWSQQGIYPSKANIIRKPGISWSLNAGFIARNFIDSLSCYANFIYSGHEADSIRINGETKQANGSVITFIPEKAQNESRTESKMVNGGFDYQVTPELALGAAVQTSLTGIRIFRTTTLMGSLRLLF